MEQEIITRGRQLLMVCGRALVWVSDTNVQFVNKQLTRGFPVYSRDGEPCSFVCEIDGYLSFPEAAEVRIHEQGTPFTTLFFQENPSYAAFPPPPAPPHVGTIIFVFPWDKSGVTDGPKVDQVILTVFWSNGETDYTTSEVYDLRSGRSASKEELLLDVANTWSENTEYKQRNTFWWEWTRSIRNP